MIKLYSGFIFGITSFGLFKSYNDYCKLKNKYYTQELVYIIRILDYKINGNECRYPYIKDDNDLKEYEYMYHLKQFENKNILNDILKQMYID